MSNLRPLTACALPGGGTKAWENYIPTGATESEIVQGVTSHLSLYIIVGHYITNFIILWGLLVRNVNPRSKLNIEPMNGMGQTGLISAMETYVI